MKVGELAERLNMRVLSGAEGLDREVEGCYVGDLLSEAVANAERGNAWVTVQMHKTVVAVASLKEVACVVLVKGLSASEEAVGQSNVEGIPFLSTDLSAYEVVGRIYALLNE